MTALGESTYEAVFDHGNEGYGVWFDGMVRDDPMYRQHWKGNRQIYLKIEEDRIVILRQLKSDDDSDSDDDWASDQHSELSGNLASSSDEADTATSMVEASNGAATVSDGTEAIQEAKSPRSRSRVKREAPDADDESATTSEAKDDAADADGDDSE